MIGAEKLAAMIELLRPFAGRKLNFADLETAGFGERILEAIKSAGWKPQVFKLKSMQPVYGVACGGPVPNDPALRALTQALEIADKRTVVRDSIAAVLGQSLQQPSDQIWVLVGLKIEILPDFFGNLGFGVAPAECTGPRTSPANALPIPNNDADKSNEKHAWEEGIR